LRLDVQPNYGLRREELIVKDVPRNVVADGRGRYDRWMLARGEARERGVVESLRVATVREWIEAEETAAADAAADPVLEAASRVAILDLSSDDESARSGGAAFGALVHQLLGDAPFDASRERLDAMAAAAARTLGVPDPGAAAAASVAARVLEHDLLRRASAAEARGACRRETPVTMTVADGRLIEGVVDLAFEEDGTWTVVDYKTDREPAEPAETAYRRQISLYAAAIARATGQPASAVIVRV
jgi:ATP-dependent exoDNAse (exonuclease V) beta subunit